ncbi:MAG: class I SAM-dependent methyltransferase [Nocardioides sp.]
MTAETYDRGGIATELAAIVTPLVGELPLKLTAWDGSVAGPESALGVVLHSPDAVRRLLWHPGELGAAQAYVTGEVDFTGNVADVLDTLMAAGRRGARAPRTAQARAATEGLRFLARHKLLGRRLPAPASQARVRGRLNSKARDAASIHHHYDLSNEFYALILDDSKAYSSAWFANPPAPDPERADGWGRATLAEVTGAQFDKLSLICEKLDLAEGDTLLDVGCGWGSLTMHAALEFGARVTAITIAEEQRRFVQGRIDAAGVGDRVKVLLCDYRDAPQTIPGAGSFDAVASIEMGEHVGQRNYPTYVDVLNRCVKPGGRVLVQQMSRTGRYPGGGPFIESFIAPDMYMRPVGETVAFIEKGGLEVIDVQAMREHYVWTVDGWLERFEANAKDLTDLVGDEVMRVWRLYLIGGRAAFRDGRMGVDQILSRKPTIDGATQ